MTSVVVKVFAGIVTLWVVLFLCSVLGSFLPLYFYSGIIDGFAGVGFLVVALAVWGVASDIVSPEKLSDTKELK